jgi:hypothetical protein
MILCYGQCSIGEARAIAGKDWTRVSLPVREGVACVNRYFREKLDALLASA